MSIAENKAVAVDFYCTAFGGEPELASSHHIGHKYVQHNPQYEDGSGAFISFIRGMRSQYPDMSLEVKLVVAEGDLVVLHSRLTLTPRDAGLALADFFRVEDGKVVEHWDVVQSVPDASENSNTMFWWGLLLSVG
jgi:predicted SnoaL-like aldol condensation-catalyzing enzyme